MAPKVPSGEPTELIAGDSWQWDKSLPKTPPSEGYTLKYEFRLGPTDLAADITAATSAKGDYFEVREAAADHTSLATGTYWLVGYVTKGADRFTVYEGEVFVQGDFDTQVVEKTFAEKMVDKLETKLLALADSTEDTKRWRRGEREEEKEDRRDLERQLAYWRGQVKLERNGGKFVTRKVHFARPS